MELSQLPFNVVAILSHTLLRFAERPIVESGEVSKGIILDFDDKGRVVGLKVLGVSEKFSLEDP